MTTETVEIVVASTVEAVGLTVQGGDTVALAVTAPVETVALTVEPDGGDVSVSVAETVEQVTLAVAPAGESVSVAIADQGDTVTLVVGEQEGPSWAELVTRWDVQPALAATITDGAVFAYQLDGVTRYRLVPSPYSPAGDAFYAGFAGGVLSDLVAARG